MKNKKMSIKEILLSIILILTILPTQRSIKASSDFEQLQKIVASDREERDWFGYSVAVSGNYAIVGAPYEDHDVDGQNLINGAGSAYIYEFDSTSISWIFKQKIVADFDQFSDRRFGAFFGLSVDISNNYAIVGASGFGDAYIFKLVDSTNKWEIQQGLYHPIVDSGDDRELSVSILDKYAIIGTPYDDFNEVDSDSLYNAGSIYIYELDEATGNWNKIQKIVANDRNESDHFGFSVDISAKYIIVGARNANEDELGNNSLNNAGAVYIFELNQITGEWTQIQKIVANEREIGDQFGHSVAISNNYAIVGSINEDEDSDNNNFLFDAGSAYIYKLDALNSTWNLDKKINAIDREVSDAFGYSVAISDSVAIVSAVNEEHDINGDNTKGFAGSAYIYINNTGDWIHSKKIVAEDRGEGDKFGLSVDLSGDYIFVGTSEEDEDDNGLNTLSRAGSAYIFGPEKSKFSLSGTVTENGSPLENIEVTIGSSTDTTNVNGVYLFEDLEAGSYTVTLISPGYNYTPEEYTIELSSDTTGFDFVATSSTTATYSLSGTITENGSPLENIEVSSGSATETTDANGEYLFEDLGAGIYTVTPISPGYNYTPEEYTIDLSSDTTGFEFEATSSTTAIYTLSGTITENGNPLRNIEVSIGSATDTTDANGEYLFEDLEAGSYTVTPISESCTFTPENQIVNLNSDQTGVDFIIDCPEDTYSLSGKISDDLYGAQGIEVGNGISTVITDFNGEYIFENLIAGSYTITPLSESCTFNPTQQEVNLIQDETGVDFIINCISDDESSLWAWGDNRFEGLGFGDDVNRSKPEKIGTENNWISISSGSNHRLAIKNDKSLWSWGRNWYGELGLGDEADKSTPTQVGFENSWKIIAAGGNFSLAIKDDGSLWSWGANDNGQLGLGDNTKRSIPTRVGIENNWEKVYCGWNHALALKSDGTIWSWGDNTYGELGLGDLQNRNIPTQIGLENDWIEFDLGTVVTIGIKTDGTMWSWGSNEDYVLGEENRNISSLPNQVGTDSNWQKVSVGRFVAVAIKTDGTMWSWGSSESYGLLGQGFSNDIEYSPTQIGSDSDWVEVSADAYQQLIALKSNGSLWGWGENLNQTLGLGIGFYGSYPEPIRLGHDNDWEIIASGFDQHFAIKNINYIVDLFSISGNISDGQNGIEGIEVKNGSSTVLTDINGSYRFVNLLEGDYTINPVSTDNTFNPVDTTFTLSQNVSDIDFRATADPKTYSLSGRVTENGTGLEGVEISNDIETVLTDADGYYTFFGMPSSTDTIRPNYFGYHFSPEYYQVNVPQDTLNIDFSASHPFEFDVSGSVIDQSGNPIEGVEVEFTVSDLGITFTVNTNDNGEFSQRLPFGTYSLLYKFNKYSISPNNVTLNIAADTVLDVAVATLINPSECLSIEQIDMGKTVYDPNISTELIENVVVSNSCASSIDIFSVSFTQTTSNEFNLVTSQLFPCSLPPYGRDTLKFSVKYVPKDIGKDIGELIVQTSEGEIRTLVFAEAIEYDENTKVSYIRIRPSSNQVENGDLVKLYLEVYRTQNLTEPMQWNLETQIDSRLASSLKFLYPESNIPGDSRDVFLDRNINMKQFYLGGTYNPLTDTILGTFEFIAALAETDTLKLTNGAFKWETDDIVVKPEFQDYVHIIPCNINGKRLIVRNNNISSITNIWPQPAKNSVSLEITAFTNQSINIYTAEGNHTFRTVLSKDYNKEIFQLNISDLPNGVFYIQIEGEGTQPVQSRVVKQK
ncbi:MAG: hypothetical protein Kapaf2KO_16500 [Candidatus Kapaibacteriales bacterium]